jgi:hypothetical protein
MQVFHGIRAILVEYVIEVDVPYAQQSSVRNWPFPVSVQSLSSTRSLNKNVTDPNFVQAPTLHS